MRGGPGGRSAPTLLGAAFDDVLAAAQRHQGWALTRLYHSVAPAVAGYVRAQGVREVEDVTNEVLTAVLCRCSAFRGSEAQFRCWVFTIAHRRVVDARRAEGRRPDMASLEAEGADRVEAAHASAAEDEALCRLGTERVRGLLATLSPDQRDVLALRIVGGLTVEEVAVALEKQPGAVKALQRRALATLRRRFSRQGGSGEVVV